jgi:hypothetical protein
MPGQRGHRTYVKELRLDPPQRPRHHQQKLPCYKDLITGTSQEHACQSLGAKEEEYSKGSAVSVTLMITKGIKPKSLLHNVFGTTKEHS